MSTILKALKRLDEQRRADSAPRTLEQEVLAGGAARRPDPAFLDNKWRFLAGGAAAVLLVAAVSWVAMSRREAPPVDEPAPVAASPASRPAPELGPRSAQPARGAPVTGTPVDAAVRAGMTVPSARGDAVPSARPPRADEPEDALAAGTAGANGVTASELPSEAPPPLVAQIPRGLDISKRRAQSAAVSTPPEPSAAPTAAPAPASAKSETPQSQPAASTQAPVASTAPSRPAAEDRAAATQPAAAPAEVEATGRAAAPAATLLVHVERTQWHPSPGKRSALVRIGEAGEARELREGDAVDGIVVKEIRPSGVVFVRDGSEFKRSVGES